LRAPIRAGLSPPCEGIYRSVASPNGTGNNILFSVSTINVNDVWAVGVYTSTGGYDRTLAEHWNGSSWVKVATPNPSAYHSDLTGVSAIATNDVWAIGAYQVDKAGTVIHTFAEHWNGSAWSLVTSTLNPTPFSVLNAVAAISANDVWAVGTFYSGGYLPLTEHWNGTSWTQVFGVQPSPSDNQLLAVSAFSSTDVWAVGEWSGTGSGATSRNSFAEHWNGSAWSLVTTPNLGAGADNLIFGVAPLEAGHAVGVGLGNYVANSTRRQGAAWDLLAAGGSTVQFESGPGVGDNSLLNVARSGAGVWAVGYSRNTATSARLTLAIPATWDSGTHALTWGSPRLSDSPSGINNALYAVAAITPDVFWATGYSSGPTVDRTLTELFCGIHLEVNANFNETAGVPFSVDVTVSNADASTATRYVGTVHFTSSDPQAVLPADYTFTPGDSGTHTFAGVVLNTPYYQAIKVNDTATPFVKGAYLVYVRCAGACQSSSVPPGGRAGAAPGPGGVPSGRSGAAPGPSASPGVRSPIQSAAGALDLPSPRLSAVGGRSNAVARATVSTASAKSSIRVGTHDTTRVGTVSAAAQISKGFVAHEQRDRVLASLRPDAVRYRPDLVGNVEVAISLGLLLGFGLLAVRRRRRLEESNVHNQA
jgi:hypothetical protein